MSEVRPIDANALKKDLSEFNYEMALRIVDVQPTIETEVRYGRWVPTEYDSYSDGVPVWDKWECSECGHEHNGEEDTLTTFCPDCGASMDVADINVDDKGDASNVLKPCPFCGNNISPTIMTIAEIECDDSDEWKRSHYVVVCNYNHTNTIGCGASTGYYANSPEEATDIWNRRC